MTEKISGDRYVIKVKARIPVPGSTNPPDVADERLAGPFNAIPSAEVCEDSVLRGSAAIISRSGVMEGEPFVVHEELHTKSIAGIPIVKHWHDIGHAALPGTEQATLTLVQA